MKRRINAIFLALILVSSFFLGGLFSSGENITAYADTYSGSFTNTQTASKTMTIQKAGRYYIELKGGQGSSLSGTNYDGIPLTGGKGGYLAAFINLNAGDVLTINNQAGGGGSKTEDGWTISSRGGGAIWVTVNGTPILGAGGGGAACTSGGSSSYPAGPGYDVNTTNNNKFASGSSSLVYAEWNDGSSYMELRAISGVAPLGGTAPGSASTAWREGWKGYAGCNYVALPSGGKLLHSANQGIGTNSTYVIALEEDMQSLPINLGKSVAGSVSSYYSSDIDQEYTVRLQTNGGDCISGNISLNAGQYIIVLRTLTNTGTSWLVIVDDKVVMTCGGTKGSQTTARPAINTALITGALTNSYYDGAYFSGVSYDNTGSANSLLHSITVKQATLEDSYQYSKITAEYTKISAEAEERQAVAQEKIASALDSLLADGGGIGGSNTVFVVNVVAGQQFMLNVSGSLASEGSFTVSGVTAIENDKNDGFIYLTGTLNTVGPQDIVFGGTKIPFNVVEEPNSANVNVVLQ